MGRTRNTRDADLQILGRLKALAWLSASELKLLIRVLVFEDFKRRQIIVQKAEPASEVHILLTGIARITCMSAKGKRVTVALLGAGPIPAFPPLPLSQFDFRFEAYRDCRVGSLGWNDFNGVSLHGADSALRKFHENDAQQWFRLLLRVSCFLNLDLHERVAHTLLELCSDFGIVESRGTLLGESFSHNDIADLVGATRPRVTEHLAQLEREELVVRQGRRLIVRVGELSKSVGAFTA